MLFGKRVVALCISRIHDLENCRFVMELNEKLRKQNCSLWVYVINTDLYWNDTEYNAETSVFELIDYAHTDVVIIMDEKIKSRKTADSIIQDAQTHHVPVIITDGTHENCSDVRFDYRRGFELIVRHVFEHHHVEHPHFMGGIPNNPFSDERMEVYRQVVEEYGIPFSEDMVSYGHFWAKPAKAATAELLTREQLPDAIFCANDIMAINVCAVLTEHGVRIPEDVIVTGFDGIDEINFSTPAISSVRCGTSGMTKTVFAAVMDALDGKPPKSYLVEPDLLLNRSCGCTPDEDSQGLDHMHSFNDRFYRYQDDNRALTDMCERMQSFSSIEASSYTLFGDVLQDLCCLINQSCTDDTKDYFAAKREPSFEDRMLLFFDTDQQPFLQYEMQRSDVIPKLQEVMENGYPLIFSALDFMNVPIGYLCFHFKEYEVTDYCKLPQIVTTLSIGLGGFINRQYQNHLIHKIEEMYRYDPLTGLCNRLSFSKDFEALCEKHGDSGMPLTVLLSDLDGLKHINDDYGHAAGDNAIASAAAALRFACPPNALCVRFGGDEMIAIIPGDCDGDTIVKQIHQYLADYNMHSGLPYQLTTSVGLYRTKLCKKMDFEVLLRNADQAMYTIKQRKKRGQLHAARERQN